MEIEELRSENEKMRGDIEKLETEIDIVTDINDFLNAMPEDQWGEISVVAIYFKASDTKLNA